MQETLAETTGLEDVEWNPALAAVVEAGFDISAFAQDVVELFARMTPEEALALATVADRVGRHSELQPVNGQGLGIF